MVSVVVDAIMRWAALCAGAPAQFFGRSAQICPICTCATVRSLLLLPRTPSSTSRTEERERKDRRRAPPPHTLLPSPRLASSSPLTAGCPSSPTPTVGRRRAPSWSDTRQALGQAVEAPRPTVVASDAPPPPRPSLPSSSSQGARCRHRSRLLP